MPLRVTELSSLRNPRLQDVRQAASRGRYTESGLLVAEGPHLLEELLRSRWVVETVLLTSKTLAEWRARLEPRSIEVAILPERVLSSVSGTETSQGVLALVEPRTWHWDDLSTQPQLVVVLDRIQDPGNAGAILRSAEAFGASGIVLLESSVQISNGKFIRAAAGSLFRLPVLRDIDRSTLLAECRSRHWNLFALHAGAGTQIHSANWLESCALIIGNEGQGIQPELLAASQPVSISTAAVESLNAAIACSIALYEAASQRSAHTVLRPTNSAEQHDSLRAANDARTEPRPQGSGSSKERA